MFLGRLTVRPTFQSRTSKGMVRFQSTMHCCIAAVVQGMTGDTDLTVAALL